MLLPAFEKWKGVEVEEEHRNRWTKDVIKTMNEDPDEYVAYTMSGDSLIIAFRPEGEGIIEILDCKIRHRMMVDDALHKKDWEE